MGPNPAPLCAARSCGTGPVNKPGRRPAALSVHLQSVFRSDLRPSSPPLCNMHCHWKMTSVHPFRLGMAGPSPAQQLLQARHVQSKAIPGCCQAASTPGCMPHRRAPMQSSSFFWCEKRSLESMYLAFQTCCRPDSFSGIYQNHRF